MTTVLLVLVILSTPAALAWLIGKRFRLPGAARAGGLIGLSSAFLLFAVGHFTMTDSMVEMLPSRVPARSLLVFGTGLLEIAIAAGLLIGKWRAIAAWTAAAALIVFFPANIYAAVNAVGPGGHQSGPAYLLVRAPLQALLLFWTYWFAIRQTPR